MISGLLLCRAAMQMVAAIERIRGKLRPDHDHVSIIRVGPVASGRDGTVAGPGNDHELLLHPALRYLDIRIAFGGSRK